MEEVMKEIKISELSYEETMRELDKICNDLQSGNLNLEDAVAAFELGTKLRKHAKSKLVSAKMKIEMVGDENDATKGFEALTQVNNILVETVCESYNNQDLDSINKAIDLYRQKVNEIFKEIK